MKPNVVDFAAWRSQRVRPAAPVRPAPVARPVAAAAEAQLFWRPRKSRSRLFLWALMALFLFAIIAAWAQIIDRNVMIFGLIGLPVVAFILWASSSEDNGDRPSYALDGQGLVIDPAGEAKRYSWDKMVGLEWDREESRMLLSVQDSQTSCASCTPVVRTLPLAADARSSNRRTLGDTLLAEAQARGIDMLVPGA